MLAALRAVNATSDGVNLNTYSTVIDQPPFLSPTVFNYYPPSYQIQGTSLLGPEFKLLNANTTMARINFINDLLYATVGPNTHTDISQYVALGNNVVPACLPWSTPTSCTAKCRPNVRHHLDNSVLVGFCQQPHGYRASGALSGHDLSQFQIEH